MPTRERRDSRVQREPRVRKSKSKKGARRVKGASRAGVGTGAFSHAARDTHTLCSRARPRRHPSLPLSSHLSLVLPLVLAFGVLVSLLSATPTLSPCIPAVVLLVSRLSSTNFFPNYPTLLPRARLDLPITTSTTPSTARPIYLVRPAAITVRRTPGRRKLAATTPHADSCSRSRRRSLTRL